MLWVNYMIASHLCSPLLPWGGAQPKLKCSQIVLPFWQQLEAYLLNLCASLVCGCRASPLVTAHLFSRGEHGLKANVPKLIQPFCSTLKHLFLYSVYLLFRVAGNPHQAQPLSLRKSLNIISAKTLFWQLEAVTARVLLEVRLVG